MGEKENPISQNKYTYVQNNPFKYRDDSGHYAMNAFAPYGGGNVPAPSPYPSVLDLFQKDPIQRAKEANQKAAADEAARRSFNASTGGINIPAMPDSELYKIENPSLYADNFIGPKPPQNVQKVAHIDGKTYNLNNPTEAVIYQKHVDAIATRKRAEARVQKQCEEADINLADYHWSTIHNKMVDRGGKPSDEATRLYFDQQHKQAQPPKNALLEYYNQMATTGRDPLSGRKLSQAEINIAKAQALATAISPALGSLYIRYSVSNPSVSNNSNSTTKIPSSTPPKLSTLSEVEKLKIANQYKKTAPVGIPEGAKVNAKTMTAGYEQITYKWNDGQFKYEARWHTRTPGAPVEQGDTWVVQRTIPGNGGNKPQTFFKIGDNEWVEGYKWYAAISARQAGNATAEQVRILDKGYWKE